MSGESRGAGTEAVTTGGDLLELTKHEGAGNDFLVFVDPDARRMLTAELARALCDRHRGVGADGLIRIARSSGAQGADLMMELANADGSGAETSGNGLRCAAQAAVLGGLVAPPHVVVATAAGLHEVEYTPCDVPWEARASVSMGVVVAGPELDLPLPARRSREVDVGNPHLVVQVDDPAEVDLEGMAVLAARELHAAVNVEVIAATGRDELVLAVWERGAGPTLACGSGSCAAAAAARSWGLVGDRVRVRNPGGTLEVVLSELAGATEPGRLRGRRSPVSSEHQAVLLGPVRLVAKIQVGPSLLSRAAPPAAAPAARAAPAASGEGLGAGLGAGKVSGRDEAAVPSGRR